VTLVVPEVPVDPEDSSVKQLKPVGMFAFHTMEVHPEMLQATQKRQSFSDKMKVVANLAILYGSATKPSCWIHSKQHIVGIYLLSLAPFVKLSYMMKFFSSCKNITNMCHSPKERADEGRWRLEKGHTCRKSVCSPERKQYGWRRRR